MATSSIPPDQPLASPPAGAVSDFAHPQNQMHYQAFIASISILFTISTLSVLARIWTRSLIVRRFGWDDAFALIAMLLNVLLTVAFFQELWNGVADNDWNVRAIDWITDNMDNYSLWNGVAAIVYAFTAGCIKISILMLYLRLLGKTYTKSRIAVYLMIAIVTGTSVGCGLYILKFCSPILKLFRPEVPGTCDVDTDLFYAQAVITVITDVFILIPPIPFIWGLSASKTRKLGLTIVLCCGFVVTGLGIYRAVWFAHLNDSWGYRLYNNYAGVVISIYEVNIGIAAICLPALAILFRRLPIPFLQDDRYAMAHLADEIPPPRPVRRTGSPPRDEEGSIAQLSTPSEVHSSKRGSSEDSMADLPAQRSSFHTVVQGIFSRFSRSDHPRDEKHEAVDEEKGGQDGVTSLSKRKARWHGVTVQKWSLRSIATQSMNSEQRRWVHTLPPVVPTETFRGQNFND